MKIAVFLIVALGLAGCSISVPLDSWKADTATRGDEPARESAGTPAGR